MKNKLAQFFNFSGDYFGLTDDDMAESVELYGKNTYSTNDKEIKSYSVKQTLLSPSVILMFVVAIACFASLQIAMGIAVLLIVAGYTVSEIYTSKALDKRISDIRSSTAVTFRVIRNGKLSLINKEELLTNDIIVVSAGERVPVDAFIRESRDLTVDEAVLSGVHTAVVKNAGTAKKSALSESFVYSGTIILSGTAICEVTAVGVDTKLYQKYGETKQRHSYYTIAEKTVQRITPLCSAVAGVIALLTMLLWAINGNNVLLALLRGLTLGLCFIPTSLSTIIRLYYTKCASELLSNMAVVRSLEDIEKLNSVNVLCVEKNGTLAKNTVEIKHIFAINQELFYNIAVLACDRNTTDPSDKALLLKATFFDENIYEVCEKNTLLERLPDGDEKLDGALWDLTDTKLYCVRGIPEQILPLCRMSGDELYKVQNKINEYYAQGLRIIAVACTDATEGTTDSTAGFKYSFIGLAALTEPLRDSVSAAVSTCRRVGVRVVMMSEDNASVSSATGKNIGLAGSSVLSANEVASAMDNNAAINTDVDVLSMLNHEQKLFVLNSMKQNGDVVAVAATGADEVELIDSADIGITLSQQTSGAAYESADILMNDDNFATIARTIAASRQTHMNIKRAVSAVISGYAAIIMMNIINIFCKTQLMINPSLLAVLSMIIIPASALMYLGSTCDNVGLIKPSAFVSRRKLNIPFIVDAALFTLFAAVSSEVTYMFMYNSNNSNYARSCALVTFCISTALSGLVRASNNSPKNLLRLKLISVFCELIIIILPILLIYIPVVNSAFGLMQIDFLAFVISAVTGIILHIVYLIIRKLLRLK